ncbi:fungal hydrophobin [Agrocybe pediades]|nr:fungal hydrophobin [Agrocybe pediades]
MKFATVTAILAASAASVVAYETNAQRMARGLPPNAPVRRATPVAAARRGQPSGISGSCNTGPVQCCNSVTHANNAVANVIAKLLGIALPANVAVGLTCSPLSVIGVGGNHCNSQPVCCENNSFNGLIAIGCSPININL